MLLSGSITGRGVSIGVINCRDFQYLASIADGVPFHLGYVLATTLHHHLTER